MGMQPYTCHIVYIYIGALLSFTISIFFIDICLIKITYIVIYILLYKMKIHRENEIIKEH